MDDDKYYVRRFIKKSIEKLRFLQGTNLFARRETSINANASLPKFSSGEVTKEYSMADWNSVGEHSNGPSKCAGTTCVNAHRLSRRLFGPLADFLFASRESEQS